MIAFEVHRNGEKLCTAGVTDGVLTAILTWVGGKKHDEEAVRSGATARQLDLHVDGLQSPGDQVGQHLKWRNDALLPGDSVLIKVIESDAIDPPVSRKLEDPELVEEAERMQYEVLRKKYEHGGA